jgi:hypothetical protein
LSLATSLASINENSLSCQLKLTSFQAFKSMKAMLSFVSFVFELQPATHENIDAMPSLTFYF